MAVFELKMPKLGESVTEGTIGKWLKQPGERVEKYDLLVEVQTDKVNTEIPSEVSGTLREVKAQEGETVPVGALLAVFETSEAEVVVTATAAKPTRPPAPAPAAAAPPAPAPRAAAPAPVPPVPAPAPSGVAAVDIRATPAVRKLAAEHGLDLGAIQGTGLGGRVSRKDVEDAAARRGAAGSPGATPAPAPSRPASAPGTGDQTLKLTPMRKAIAENMAQAWTAPHAHAVMEIDMTSLMRYREQVRHDFAAREGFDLSPAAFIVRAAVEALRAVPLVNASWTAQGIVMHGAVNVGYAVALGDEGLVVPVIKGADQKSIAGLMRSIRDLVDRAKAKRLTFDDFAGGTFTVNNTGPLGTIISSPIVPPGQAAICSSESIVKRLVVLDDDTLAIRHRMNLVIGFDHRVVDGATAARFLQTMRDWLQAVGPGVTVS